MSWINLQEAMLYIPLAKLLTGPQIPILNLVEANHFFLFFNADITKVVFFLWFFLFFFFIQLVIIDNSLVFLKFLSLFGIIF